MTKEYHSEVRGGLASIRVALTSEERNELSLSDLDKLIEATARSSRRSRQHAEAAAPVGRVLYVIAAPATLQALVAHVERRAASLGVLAIVADGRLVDEPWRALVPMVSAAARSLTAGVNLSGSGPFSRLSAEQERLALEPDGAAEEIAAGLVGRVLRGEGGLAVVVETNPGAWGEAIARSIHRRFAADAPDSRGRSGDVSFSEGQQDDGPLVLVLRSTAPDNAQLGESPPRAVLSEQLSTADLDAFWGAVAHDLADRDDLPRLDAMQRWWDVASRTPADAMVEPASLSAAEELVLQRLVAAVRSWPRAELDHLGPPQVFERLVELGYVRFDHASQRVAPTREALLRQGGDTAHGSNARGADAALAPDERVALAHAIERVSPEDPWACVRAAELFASGGAWELAEHSLMRAINAVHDAAARDDFWRRWEAGLGALSEADRAPWLRRAADLALRVGDVDRALTLARTAANLDDGYEAMLVLGRATAARGDLTTAAINLERALDQAGDDEQRARGTVELAEVRYAAGVLDHAEQLAQEALDLVAPQRARAGAKVDKRSVERRRQIRLTARNVLGKLLLARARWDDAEIHFAADASEAACGDDAVAELRARLNRGIALYSSGQLDQARAMLRGVLDDGERLKELRAVSYALANLAAIAVVKHEYATALHLGERAIDVRRRIGEKIGLARLITNLAELRLRMGLVAEAEQALVFGRHACGDGLPSARLADFALVQARIDLSRGQTRDALSQVQAAIAGASGSSDGSMAGECYRLASRIALEDGDTERASSALAKATQLGGGGPRARGEVAILRAHLARAEGAPYREYALEALDAARGADDEELQREAHMLLYFAALGGGPDVESAGMGADTHLEHAVALRDSVASKLPDQLKASFLARREFAELAQAEAQVISQAARREAPVPATTSRRQRSGAPALARMVGTDLAMRSLANAIRKVAPSDATVFIHGESGTGKELVAEALHELSPRREGPLVKVNCAALVETLLLSELFGHEKGSFTGAVGRRRGRFEAAEGGTLFLDEIGDISPRTQVALLRVMQDKTFERVGGITSIRANVRIVCASHRDLRLLVSKGEFREDLYYRLRGVVLEVPALRERLGDLPDISQAILERVAAERGQTAKALSPRAAAALARHAWPGNIRELENALRAAALFAEGEMLEVDDFVNNIDGLRDALANAPSSLRGTMPPPSGTGPASSGRDMLPPSIPAPPGTEGLESDAVTTGDVAYAQVKAGTALSDMKREIERLCIERALSDSDGNITKAAALLGMKRPRLSQLVKQYGLGGGSSDTEEK